jgi:hypothetical protein
VRQRIHVMWLWWKLDMQVSRGMPCKQSLHGKGLVVVAVGCAAALPLGMI